MQAQAGVPKAERAGLQNMELAPVQRKIEARSAEDSFTGFVRTLYFADTFLKDSELLPPLALGDCWGLRAWRRLLSVGLLVSPVPRITSATFHA